MNPRVIRTPLAIACVVALPAALATSSEAAAEDWRAHAARSLTPAFDWAASAPAVDAQPRDLRARESLREATRRALLAGDTAAGWQLSFQSRALQVGDAQREPLVRQAASSFTGMQNRTTLRQDLGSDADVSLTAIVARNRFATPGMGLSPTQSVEQFTGVRQSATQEVSEGGGVELAFGQSLGERLLWTLSMQTRVDMDPFKAYRGIYSEAGDFDLPGHLRTGLSWAVGERWTLAADVQRVMYSDIETFTSATLPTRFLALLGDGSSPEFAWRDLTVYSAQASVDDEFGGRWTLRYSTQQQPHPSSALLSRALAEQYSDLNLGLGYQRPVGRSGQFQLSASYAPAGYFLAPAPFVQRDFDGGSQVEVEAQWSLAF